jgi:hypothetical protein
MPIDVKYAVTCAARVSASDAHPGRLVSGAPPFKEAISDPSLEIATTPSDPVQRTMEPASTKTGVDPNANLDLATS